MHLLYIFSILEGLLINKTSSGLSDSLPSNKSYRCIVILLDNKNTHNANINDLGSKFSESLSLKSCIRPALMKKMYFFSESSKY